MKRRSWHVELLAGLLLLASCSNSGQASRQDSGPTGADLKDVASDGVLSGNDQTQPRPDSQAQETIHDLLIADVVKDLVKPADALDAFDSPDTLNDGSNDAPMADLPPDWLSDSHWDLLPDSQPDLLSDVHSDSEPDLPADSVFDLIPDALPDMLADSETDLLSDLMPDSLLDTTADVDVPFCGDGLCDPDEGCVLCALDCGDCCGNSLCEPQQGETCGSCQVDCLCTQCGQECLADACQFTACDGKQCGDDGCGGDCGQCLPYEEECNQGVCVAVPDLGVDLGSGVTSWPTRLVPGESVTVRYFGSLKDRPNLKIHYGFNGWNQIDGVGMSTEDDGTGNTNFFIQAPMTPIQGGFEITIPLPLQAKALHFVFFSEDGTNKTWDNNDNKDWGTEILFPYIGPYLMWDSAVQESSTGLVVSFVTGYACVGMVEFGLTSLLGQTATESDAVVVHRLVLSELEPATEYSYRVRCGVNVSPTYTLRSSSVSVGPGGADPFSFLVFGDSQENGEHGRWRDTAEVMQAEHQDVDFLIAVGDMAWNDRPGLWWTYFDAGRDLFASKVVMPVPGNHDTPTVGSNADTSSFETFFGMPFQSGSDAYYSFSYCDSLFVALNSEWPEGFTKDSGEQFLWLSQLLGDPATSPSWAFVYWHVPPYNVGTRHDGAQGTFRDMTLLFDGHVDWYFGGHEHLYQRMKPMAYNAQIVEGNYGSGPGQGVGYLVVPPSGAWPENQLVSLSDPKAYYRDRLAYPVPPAAGDTVASELGFVRVDISGSSLVLTTFGLGSPTQPVAPHVVDLVQYSK